MFKICLKIILIKYIEFRLYLKIPFITTDNLNSFNTGSLIRTIAMIQDTSYQQEINTAYQIIIDQSGNEVYLYII